MWVKKLWGEKIQLDKKGWDKTITALIIAVIALALLFFFMLRLLPNLKDAVDNIMLGIKKPICCDMLGCKPALDQATQNPMGGIPCTLFGCWGVCD